MPLGEKFVKRLERAAPLDSAAELVARALRTVIRPGVVEDTLSGTPIGHPAHPAVVAVPIGAWTATSVFDLLGDRRTARRTEALGILAALPAAMTGASDWLTTAGAERRVGLVHAAANSASLGLHTTSWALRRRGKEVPARLLALGGTALVGLSGWIGGHLAYAMGVGVDTTAFQALPTDWVDAVAADDVPPRGVTHAEVAGIPILFAHVDGEIVAMADRCTHRGGPLHEGEVRSGCIVCPWHGSAFSLADGSIASGPASRPQPTLETEVRGNRVFVRRSEERTLRTNPVGK